MGHFCSCTHMHTPRMKPSAATENAQVASWWRLRVWETKRHKEKKRDSVCVCVHWHTQIELLLYEQMYYGKTFKHDPFAAFTSHFKPAVSDGAGRCESSTTAVVLNPPNWPGRAWHRHVTHGKHTDVAQDALRVAYSSRVLQRGVSTCLNTCCCWDSEGGGEAAGHETSFMVLTWPPVPSWRTQRDVLVSQNALFVVCLLPR